MALRAVPDHPKFADLKRRLGISKGATLGYLECVWHFAGRFTPQGNVGKYSDSQIEAWVEWEGAPGELMAAMAESRWLDRDERFRLIVHDWPANSDELVHTTLARQCVPFADGTMPKAGRLNQKERERFKEWTDLLKSNPTAREVSARISQESANSQLVCLIRQPTVSLSDRERSQQSACLPDTSANPPDFSANVPKPVPEPVPEPAIVVPPQASDPKRKAARFVRHGISDEWAAWAILRPGWDRARVDEEWDKFSDHWAAKSGKDATKQDWFATWRNWCRNAFSDRHGGLFNQNQPTLIPTHKNPGLRM